MSDEKEKFISLERIPEKPTKEEVDKMDDFGRRIEILEKEIKDATEKVDKIKDSVSESEKKINQTTKFLMFVAGAMIIAFTLAVIPLCFDYYKDNYGRYGKYLKDVNELKIRMEILEKRNDLIWKNQIKNNFKP